jgi:hypothetical protein
VFGKKCQPCARISCKVCVQYVPFKNGRTGEIRTRDQRIKSPQNRIFIGVNWYRNNQQALKHRKEKKVVTELLQNRQKP